MAENIVSPGVFTRENDLSFLPQGIGALGAAIVGPTVKGPAFVPITIRRGFSEYEKYFGGLNQYTYVPQTVKEYLRNAGTVTVVRVLAGGGQLLKSGNDGVIGLAVSGTNGNVFLGSFMPSKNTATLGLGASTLSVGSINNINKSFNLGFSGSNFLTLKNISASLLPTAADYIEKSVGTNPLNSKTGANLYEDNAFTYINFKNLQTDLATAGTAEAYGIAFPNDVNTGSLSNPALAASGAFYIQEGNGEQHTIKFSALTKDTVGNVYADTTSGASGSTVNVPLTAHDGTDVSGHMSASAGKLATLVAAGITGITGITAVVSGSTNVLITNDVGGTALDITTTFTSATASVGIVTQGAGLAGYGSQSISSTSPIILISQSANISYTSSYSEGYDHAVTPYITSQYQSGVVKELFRFHTLADGTATNTEYKISIAGLKEPGDIDGEEQYSTFNVLVRRFGDKDSRPIVLEQFNNVTLNPDASNYIARQIGDRYASYNDTFKKVMISGDYPNMSKLIRVEVAENVKDKAYSPKLSPKGFRAVKNPINAAAFAPIVSFPSASYKTESILSSNYNAKAYLGFQFADEKTDNLNFTKPLPYTNQENNVSGDFNVEDYSVHPSASIIWNGSLSASIDSAGTAGPRNKELKFSVPFQGGYDGMATSTIKQIGANIASDGTNVFGFDLSGTSAAGYTGYKKALDILSNQDEYDMNMLALPGVIKEYHSAVTDAATTMVEDRGDTFYVMDLTGVESVVSKAVSEADGLDSNYSAVYYPWVKVLDTSRNKPVFVPPSVIVPGAIAASDNIAAEWFAPAGLNRGVLGNVIEAKLRLNQAERDELYEGKVNPIATFPRTGVCIWGQKTLQQRPTALDRINVRRLLIAVKKFIASSSRYLVFEQNTLQTRNRFLNIVNPYLESVQQRQGLYAFRVVMDESNNTPEEIDRNKLIGAIYLQPTKTAEFIVLDFNVLPTGATFPA